MRRAARVDANQVEIVTAMRAVGAVVRVITQGDGLPDLLVGYRNHTVLMELKDGAKPASKRRLTEAEQKFFDEWRGGRLEIVTSVDQALDILDSLN